MSLTRLATLHDILMHSVGTSKQLSAFPFYTCPSLRSRVCHQEKEGARVKGEIEPEKLGFIK